MCHFKNMKKLQTDWAKIGYRCSKCDSDEIHEKDKYYLKCKKCGFINSKYKMKKVKIML